MKFLTMVAYSLRTYSVQVNFCYFLNNGLSCWMILLTMCAFSQNFPYCGHFWYKLKIKTKA